MGHDVELTVDDAPAYDDVEPLRAGLTRHSARYVDRPGFRPIAVFARDREGELVGGAYGYLNWNWLDFSLLWVTEAHRGRGLGARLLLRLESEARRRGCDRAHLETFSYQARAFYERHGYATFARLPDYPPGHERVYLQKRLTTEASGSVMERARSRGG